MDGLGAHFPKQPFNERAMKVYAASITALAVLIIIIRRLRHYVLTTQSVAPHHGLGAAFSRIIRVLEKRTDWSSMGQPRIGLIITVILYLVLNAILCVTPIAIYELNHFASRLGWLTALNMFLCILFGLKNTPLGQIAKVSHLEMNVLHRVVGYTTVALVLLHAVLYTWYRGRIGYWSRLIIPANLAGIGACISMLILCMGIWRHRNYELFYLSHVGGCATSLCLAYFHRPNWLRKFPFILLFASLIWLADRLVRATRMSRNALNNYATLYPLPGNATRVFLRKPNCKECLPASHCFLWIPCINISQHHPFTIVSNGPSGLELVIRPMEGFTKKTFWVSSQIPGKRVLASVDGPYGCVPSLGDFDKIVLVAGGSGAAFTTGLVNRFLNQSPGIGLENIHFIWTVRETVQLSWFYEHLCRFVKLGVQMVIYITNEEGPVLKPDEVVRIAISTSRVATPVETALLSNENSPRYDTIPQPADDEMSTGAVTGDKDGGFGDMARFHYMRMKPENAIDELLGASECMEKVLVAACGPKSLMDSVTEAVATWRGRRSIDLHCENFGSS